MALKNKSMYAILGILSISPGTGYDIKKYSDNVLAGFWHENYGHIYPTLKAMLEEEMIEVEDGEENERKIRYRITQKGEAELKAWLSEETLLQPMRSEFLLKLLFSSSQPQETVIHMIEEYKKTYVEHRRKYDMMMQLLTQGIDGVSQERSFYLHAVLSKGIYSCDATIAWCDDTISELLSKNNSTNAKH